MLKRILIFLLGILFSLTVRAKVPEFYRLYINSKSWKYTERTSFLEGKVSRELLGQLDRIYQTNPSAYEFIYNTDSQSLKVFVQCSFDFYSIQEGIPNKEYSLSNRGYTCGSYLFERANTYYLSGGRGFWIYHTDLMKFDSLNGSWEFIQTKTQPLDYFPLGNYQTSKGIISILGDYNNPRSQRLDKESNGYFLDFEKKSWQPIEIAIQEFDFAAIAHANDSRLFETEDYGFSVTTSQLPSLGWYLWILFEKETGKLFFYEGDRNADMFESPYFEFIGNQFRYFKYEPNSSTEGKEVQIDLDEVKKNSREIGKIVLLEPTTPTKKSSTSSFLPWLGLVLLPLGFWAGIQLQKRTQKKVYLSLANDPPQENVQEEKEEEILDHLHAHNGEKLSTEAFDQLLGIHEISNFDSKRIKRSRLIKSLNKQYEEKNGFPLITRIKNPEDKRYVFYKITFKN